MYLVIENRKKQYIHRDYVCICCFLSLLVLLFLFGSTSKKLYLFFAYKNIFDPFYSNKADVHDNKTRLDGKTFVHAKTRSFHSYSFIISIRIHSHIFFLNLSEINLLLLIALLLTSNVFIFYFLIVYFLRLASMMNIIIISDVLFL